MIDVFVVRGDGDVRGDDITDPLITSVAVALARGQAAVDASAPMKPVQLTAKYRDNVFPGQLCEVIDASQGAAWRGKITAVEKAVEGEIVNMRLSIEKISE